MIKYINLMDLSPADYNPRLLSEDAQEELKSSITELGIIKPIIIRKADNRILAGHQRTKTMKLLGYSKAPAFILDGVNTTDEVRFNQLHNFSECEVIEKQPDIYINKVEAHEGFIVVKNKDIVIKAKGEVGGKVQALANMITKYGQFANAVCDYTGKVIISSVYAMTAKLLGIDLLVYILPKGKEERALSFFSKEYGVFEYSNLEKKTYMQSFAQKNRLRTKNGIKCSRTHSTLYEKLVIPYITKDMRILDFGAGQKDYAMMLKKKGYQIDAIEFFHRKDSVDAIDEQEIREDCNEICSTLSSHGLYDVVVFDSVLNSVNSLEDEKNVLLCLSALCKEGGIIFWSGIPVKFTLGVANRKETADKRVKGVFLDANNFTANYRFGEWYYQHYHATKDVCRLTESYLGAEYKIYDGGKESGITKELACSSFQVMCRNERKHSNEAYEKALKYEFSLPLPKGKRWDLDKDILPVFKSLENGGTNRKPILEAQE